MSRHFRRLQFLALTSFAACHWHALAIAAEWTICETPVDPRAIDACTAVLQDQQLAPDMHARALYHRGEARRASADELGAFSDYEAALLADPNHQGARWNWEMLAGRDDPLWQQCAEMSLPDDQRLLACSRIIEDRTGATSIKRSAAFRQRADIQAGLKARSAGAADYDRAALDLNEALKLAPGHAEILIERGRVRRRQGALVPSLRDFSAAIAMSSNYASIHAMALVERGTTYFQKEDFQAARADFEEALEIDSGSRLAAFQLRQLEARARRPGQNPPQAQRPAKDGIAAFDASPALDRDVRQDVVTACGGGAALEARQEGVVGCVTQAKGVPIEAVAPTAAADAGAPSWSVSNQASLDAAAAGKVMTPKGEAVMPIPEGFLRWSDVAASGFGTFQAGLPKDWLVWTSGMATSAFLADVRRINPQWVQLFAPQMSETASSVAPGLRGLFFNRDAAEPVFVMVTLRGRFDLDDISQWNRDPRQFDGRDFFDEVEEWRWTDVQAGRALRSVSFSEDRLGMNVDYDFAEMSNGMMWNLKCIVPSSIAKSQMALCDNVARHFVPGPFVRE